MLMRFISAQPANDYYAWQVEVQINNFEKVGYSLTDMDVVLAVEGAIPQSWIKLVEAYPDVSFYFYKNEDIEMCNFYAPVVQALLLSKHFKRYPELKDTAFFFHDADFIFTKKLDFSKFLNDDKWYFSDTISYIGAEYIDSKSTDLLDRMTEIAGISSKVVRDNNKHSGGAQKLMKNLTHEYWDDVADVTISLFEYMQSFIKNNHGTHAASIQHWTASMWGELWSAWKMGFEVNIPEEFDFCWATCGIQKWDQVYFFHNAGVSSPNDGMFYKAGYMDKFPYGANLDINNDRCSYNYYSEIENVESVIV